MQCRRSEEAAERSPVIYSSGGFAANSAATVASVFLRPLETSYVAVPDTVEVRDPLTGKRRGTQTVGKNLVPVDITFKELVLMVLVISIVAVVADVALASYWPLPTSNQQRIFDGLEWLHKQGFSALIGLIGGQGVRKK
jgi:hypothetical protein